MKNRASYFFLICVFLFSCKEDTPNQIGNWKGTIHVEWYVNDSLRISDEEIEIRIEEDHTGGMNKPNHFPEEEFEWQFMGEGDQILFIFRERYPQYRDSFTFFHPFRIGINEKNYQEWIREESPGSSVWWRISEYKLERVE
ncbi:MAG: hypothetical protein AB8F74_21840 [Saprospiraceae bacterium]